MVFVLCLDDVSDVVVVHSVIHFKTLKFPKWWKSLLWDTTNLNERNLWQQQERQAADAFYRIWCSGRSCSAIHFKTLQFPEWWKSLLQESTNLINVIFGRNRNVEQQFAHRWMWFYLAIFWAKYFICSFSSTWTITLLRNIKLKNLLLNKPFTNFRLQKHRIILLCC